MFSGMADVPGCAQDGLTLLSALLQENRPEVGWWLPRLFAAKHIDCVSTQWLAAVTACSRLYTVLALPFQRGVSICSAVLQGYHPLGLRIAAHQCIVVLSFK